MTSIHLFDVCLIETDLFLFALAIFTYFRLKCLMNQKVLPQKLNSIYMQNYLNIDALCKLQYNL